MADILIVDDDQSIATAFQRFLDFEGHVSRVASNAEDGIRMIAERQPNLVIMDIRMPGVDGLTALTEMRGRFPDVPVVMMTGYGTSQTSIDAIRAGAFDYLMKPLDLDELRLVIGRVLAAQQLLDGARSSSREALTLPPAVGLVGETPAMLDVYKMIGRLATNDVPALVVGERGTGKRLVMATIHENSARRARPFTPIDCSVLPEAAIEAELYGDAAGTIQLAAIEALPMPAQARLAMALDEHTPRAGGRRPSARVLASTERDLTDAVRTGIFSRALYDTLAVIKLELPPLRARRDDIPLLVRHFVQRFNSELSRAIRGVDERAARMLQDHPWPGNVGELERAIKRGSIVARGEVITADDIGRSLSDSQFQGGADGDSALGRTVRTALHDRLVQPAESSSAYHDIVDLVETTLVHEALTITNGNQVKAAEILGVNRATLRKKIPAGDE